ncbi:MAG: segregation/condensation protein A [Oscillospiraceae bacterium]|nr:segregation/condensation protein A [Oscillospiraceae bacterium]
MEPTYHLEGIVHSKDELADFEGPLNLILLLLSRNKIEIRDIQVSKILDQYMEYLATMESMDLEVASEFVQMASHLLYIKTRTLLAAREEVSELEELMQSLEQLKARDVLGGIKEAAPELGRMSTVGSLYIPKPPEPLRGLKEYRYRHESWELMQALVNAFSRVPEASEAAQRESRRPLIPRRIVYSICDKSCQIIDRLKSEGRLPLTVLYEESGSRSEVVAAFVSVLELCSSGYIHLTLSGEELIVEYLHGSAEDLFPNREEEKEE